MTDWLRVHAWDTIFGALVAMLTAIVVEYLRSPKLVLRIAPPVGIEYPPGRPASNARYLHVFCENKKPIWLVRWMSREAALDCYGFVSFHSVNGKNVFGKKMPLRWSDSPQPVPMEVRIGEDVGYVWDPNRMVVDSRVDIHPGTERALDTVVRFDGDSECYGWNNDSYFSNPQWRNPAWRLHPGIYHVRVIVLSGSARSVEWFRLVTGNLPNEFRLEEPPSEDGTPFDDEE